MPSEATERFKTHFKREVIDVITDLEPIHKQIPIVISVLALIFYWISKDVGFLDATKFGFLVFIAILWFFAGFWIATIVSTVVSLALDLLLPIVPKKIRFDPYDKNFTGALAFIFVFPSWYYGILFLSWLRALPAHF